MTAPFVGLPTEGGFFCAFSLSLDGAGCSRDAVVHLAVRTPAWGLVALSSCALHGPIARSAGEVVAEHPQQPACLVSDCWSPEVA